MDARDSRPVVRIVDDDPSLRRAVSRRLEAAGFETRPYESVAAFLEHELRDAGPGCVVLDLHMPHANGLELQEQLERAGDPLPVIFLTAYGDVPTSVIAMKRGALDFLTKPVAGDRLVAAVTRAVAADAAARTARQQLREVRRRYETLTPREREVFALVARGMLNKQIAYDLGTTERTIKAHRKQVMTKMEVESVADLVRAAGRLAGSDRDVPLPPAAPIVSARPSSGRARGGDARGTRPDRRRRR